MAADELLYIVDAQDNPLPSPLPRQAVHADGTIWHRTSSIIIMNDAGQILCQQRSLFVDKNPGKWTFGFGGHVLFGEEVIDSALKELQEELTLEIAAEDLTFFERIFDPRSMHAEYIYFLQLEQPAEAFAHNLEEVAQVRWLDAADVVTRSQTTEFSFPLYREVQTHLGL